MVPSGLVEYPPFPGNLEICSSNHGGGNLLITTPTHSSQLVTSKRDQTRSSASDDLRSFSTTQPSLLLFHLQHLRLSSFPPSTSPILLSQRSPLSALPVRAVDPSLRRGKYATLTLNPDSRLSVNWWSLAV
jgi:hypothetical protein